MDADVAPHLLQWSHTNASTNKSSTTNNLVDNRDYSVLDLDTVIQENKKPSYVNSARFYSKEETVCSIVRTGLMHNVLCRAVVCTHLLRSGGVKETCTTKWITALSDLLTLAEGVFSNPKQTDKDKYGLTLWGAIFNLCRIILIAGNGCVDKVDSNGTKPSIASLLQKVQQQLKEVTASIPRELYQHVSLRKCISNVDKEADATMPNPNASKFACSIVASHLVPLLTLFHCVHELLSAPKSKKKKKKKNSAAAKSNNTANKPLSSVGLLLFSEDESQMTMVEFKAASKCALELLTNTQDMLGMNSNNRTDDNTNQASSYDDDSYSFEQYVNIEYRQVVIDTIMESFHRTIGDDGIGSILSNAIHVLSGFV
uniref:Uncharacterized protein n=1 Tax=Proboscia inermis TaxID=420281 RepID=A0A6T8IP89_9STRA|mmetsp:Transcript_26328/g.26711  ORF Transcript_26328/g.26711 Transcript_26328/m.26711 type:complete len:370 (+) Transcript_26328:3-1112(+)